MSKVKWDSFDRVAVIVTPTGLSDVHGQSGTTSAYISPDDPSLVESELRYHAVEIPVAFEDQETKAWVELFESVPDSIDIEIGCGWGEEDPLTMEVELRLMDADGNDVSAGIQTIDRSHFPPTVGYYDYAVITFNTSGMFSTGEDTGAAGHYLFRTGDMTGISLPAPEPLPPPAPPVTSSYPSDYRPPQPISSDSPFQPTGGTVVKGDFILSRVCSYDGLNTGFDNGITCQLVRIPIENVYYFKDFRDLEDNSDRYQGRDSFRDPSRAGLPEAPKYVI